MRERVSSLVSLPVFVLLVSGLILSCARVQVPKPKVVRHPSRFPNSLTVSGVSLAVILFDPQRDVYADPDDPTPQRPDFNWFKAGVLPTRFIFANDSPRAVIVDPSQITCTGDKGITYKPYNPREASDAVVASEAFNAYVKGAVAGAALGAALGAGTGAAIGAIAGRRGWAGRGAAIGAALGGTRGLFLGSARNRRAMERRVRMVLRSNQLRRKVLAQGMSHEGLIYFPAVNIQSVRVVTAGRGRQEPFQIDIPVSRPIQK